MWISGLKELKGLCQGCPIMPTQEFKQRRMLTGSGLFALLSRGFEQIFGQIVSIRVKTLSHTNMVALLGAYKKRKRTTSGCRASLKNVDS